VDDLLDLFKTGYKHATGAILKPAAMAVVSGAFSQHVYKFVKRARHRQVYPIKDAAGMRRDQIDTDRRARQKRTAKRLMNGRPPEILGVDSIKRTVYAYLAAEEGKPGYCHFPPAALMSITTS